MAGVIGNSGGKKGRSGSPGYGALKLIRDNVKKHCPEWWKGWEEMMSGKVTLSELKKWQEGKMDTARLTEILKSGIDLKKFAMTEFNKLQAKLMPTIIGGDDDSPLIVKFDGPFNITPTTKKGNRK